MAEISCNTNQNPPELDQNFWDNQWAAEETGWDIGYAAPAIADYIAQYPDKNARVLIPGCGNAYEVEALLAHGFQDITVIDIAPTAVEILKEKFKDNPEVKVVCADFFDQEGTYDLMIEQTFFCAISPLLRKKYAEKAFELLDKKGKIVGVFFDKIFEKKGPPFGGSIPEYEFTFKKFFDIHTMEPCYNSIPPRKGSEVFINLIKKNA